MYDFYFHSFTTLLLAYISNIQIMFPHLKSCVRCIILVNVWIDGDLNTHLAQQFKYKREGSGNKRESDIVILSFWSIFLQEYKMLEKYFGQLSKIYLARFNMRSIFIYYLYYDIKRKLYKKEQSCVYFLSFMFEYYVFISWMLISYWKSSYDIKRKLHYLKINWFSSDFAISSRIFSWHLQMYQFFHGLI